MGGPEGWEAQNFTLFLSLYCQNFHSFLLSLSWGPFVEFKGCCEILGGLGDWGGGVLERRRFERTPKSWTHTHENLEQHHNTTTPQYHNTTVTTTPTIGRNIQHTQHTHHKLAQNGLNTNGLAKTMDWPKLAGKNTMG